ncbi:EEIG1/EHBP1 N-terminal domain-containing protein [Cynara cardunculus var. scolymus]|uniref:EEIG1/EHBP1 N-terminal domain-containing protein n=1 Tax=Cynara cardunculus var. scolymus TaxID=59895 RepID=A0A103YE48_CYNCS|nr:EEIG1/EHBP1 N-terminal domain-containing protein [Cynara cardunculus var. scolymus]
MAVRMMNWRPWPPLSSKKFEAKIVVCRLQGLPEKITSSGGGGGCGESRDFSKLGVEVKWKGSIKSNNRLNFKRSSVKRNLTKEESLNDDGVVEWNEEFVAVCNLVAFRDGFHQWEVAFRVFDGLNQGPKRRDHAVATGSLNLAEFSSAEQEKTPISIHLSVPDSVESVVPPPLLPYNEEVSTTFKDEPSGLKAGIKKFKIFRVISANRTKIACREEEVSDGKSITVRTEGADYPFDTDSLNGSDGVDSEDVDYADSSVRKSFSYGTLANANHAGRLSYFNSSGSEDEDQIYYRNYKTEAGDLSVSMIDHSEKLISKRRIFPWRKRKLSFRSPKAKGEPLLKKDHHRSDEGSTTSRSSISGFGDDDFAVGRWDNMEVTSRDGQMKLQTQIFFASIDQRSEKASGESACTTLVATIADWFQNNRHEMPIKSELDSLIREGSLEWRNLCENEVYKKRFPDKHFDLETVLQAKIRNLAVIPEKSFIGFFQPNELQKGVFDFLDGAMSFDSIWDEISQIGSNHDDIMNPLVYIVSWNDHFFILKIDRDAYYIIDTLGERLYEGCSQAYMLKFNQDTRIQRVPNETENPNEKKEGKKADRNEVQKEEFTVFGGKESCKEYIKSFLAAIPIRELQADLKKGLTPASSPLLSC